MGINTFRFHLLSHLPHLRPALQKIRGNLRRQARDACLQQQVPEACSMAAKKTSNTHTTRYKVKSQDQVRNHKTGTAARL